VIVITPDVRIVHSRSSARPIEYAVTLRVHRGDRYRTIHLFDNAHDESEHHEHRYIGFEKQQPPSAVWRGPWRAAMATAVVKLKVEWADILDDWERS